RWSSSRLSRTAMSHATVSTCSSWKLESSQTTHVPGSTVSATSVSGVCSLPASVAATPAAVNIAPSSRTVVVFPFVPVTPSSGLPGRSRQPSSISLQIGIPRVAAAAATGERAGTPGLFTTRSTPVSTDSSSVPRWSSTPVPASLPGSASAERSLTTTSTPRAARASAADSPLTASPSTRARRGSSSIRAYFASETADPRLPEDARDLRVPAVDADDPVDGRVGQRQDRQLAEQVVEPRVGQVVQQPLELVHRRLEDDDLVEPVERPERGARRIGPEHGQHAGHLWWK